MKAKQTESSLSFLQRFEGKKSTVTKEGLHHLFDLQLRKTKDRNSDEQEQKKIQLLITLAVEAVGQQCRLGMLRVVSDDFFGCFPDGEE